MHLDFLLNHSFCFVSLARVPQKPAFHAPPSLPPHILHSTTCVLPICLSMPLKTLLLVCSPWLIMQCVTAHNGSFVR